MFLLNASRFIKKNFGKAAVVVVVLVMAFALNNTFFHFGLPFHASRKTTITQAGPAQITKIEPIVLDCRALVTAMVPAGGKRSHQAGLVGIHFTYRTDTVKVTAIGDVETCVNGGAQISQTKDGGWMVIIPASSIVFDRPRVDIKRTAKSLQNDKGWFGKLTDAAPWVSEDNGLTMGALSFAQDIIGGSSCMEAAWRPTQETIRAAYQQQAKAKHIDPKKVTVVIDGTPDFNQNNKRAHGGKLGGVNLSVDTKHITCHVRSNALKIK